VIFVSVFSVVVLQFFRLIVVAVAIVAIVATVALFV